MQNFARCPKRTIVLSVVVCFALTPTLLAQTGEIHGHVYDDTPLPVDGLNVELYRTDGEHLDSTSTFGGGAYAFTGLADDDYLVRVTSDPANGLLGEYYDGVNEHDQDLAARVTVSGGGTVAGVDFELSADGSISGTLSGLVPGESIRLDIQDALTGRWRGNAYSDPVAFEYTIESLAPGTYILGAVPEGTDRAVRWFDGRDRQSQADNIALGAGEDLAGIDLTLTAGTSIAGTVTLTPDPADGGATVQQIRMDAIDASSHEWVVSRSPEASGAYQLPNLPPGTYVVQAESSWLGYVREMWVSSGGPAYQFHEGEPISVDAGSPRLGVDFDLQLGWTIEGHAFIDSDGDELQDAGEPDVQWTGIQANQTDGSYWTGGGTDASGDFSVYGLAPGTYELSIESSQVDYPFVAEKWDGRLWSGPGDTVSDVGADGIETGIDFSVVEDKVISGKVFLDADDDQVQDVGEPGFNNVTVRAYDIATGRHEGHAAFGPGGVYSLGVAAGLYRVEAQPHQGTLLREYWQNVYFSDQATLVDVTSADASGIDFGLVDGAAYGTLRGRLVAASSGVPVPGVHVQVHRYATGEHGWDATTGADGRFVVVNLPPGSYSLYFETQGTNDTHDTDYVASWWSSTGLSNDPDSTHHRIDYPETPGDGTDLGDVELEVGGSISGTVTRAGAGTPVEGFSIACDLRSDPLGRGFGLGAQTDASGQYRVRGLLPGDYEVRTTGGVSGLANATHPDLVVVAAGGAVTGIDFALAAGTSISGTVALSPDPGDGGATLQQIWVDAVDPETHHHLTTGSVASDGTYVIDNLAPGSYLVKTEQSNTPYISELWTAQAGVPGAPPVLDYGEATPIAVDAGSPATGIDFLLDEGRSITGHVFLDSLFENGVQDVGEPDVAGANVNANLLDGSFGNGGQTDASGNYVLRGLAPGEYQVSVSSTRADEPFVTEQWDDRSLIEPPDPVDVTGADAAGIDFAVVQGRVISGQIFLDLDGDQVRDAGEPPFQNVSLEVNDFTTGHHLGNAPFGADGTYAIGVPPGAYRVRAWPHQSGVLGEYWDDAFFHHDATPVDVVTADASGIDFGLVNASEFGTLRGRLVAAGTLLGIPDVHVQIRHFDTGEHNWNATTDATGNFVAVDLPPGSYAVYFETQGTNDAHDTDYMASPWSSTGLSNDPDPTHHRIDYPAAPGDGTDLGTFELEVGGSIAGSVTRAVDGTPVEGYWISCDLRDDPSGRWFSLGGQTDSNGDYLVRGLLPGDYEVRTAGGVSGLADATYPDLVTLASGGAVTGIDFALEAGTSISGTVALSPDPGDGGATLQQMWVDAVDPETHHHLTTGSVAADGTYVIDNLAPGSYLVKTEQSNTPYISELWTAQAAVPGAPPVLDYNEATAIAVDAGSPATGIDFLLEEGRAISGHVFLDSLVENGVQDVGEPDVANASVQADLVAGGWGWGGSTDAFGDFQLQGLLPGLYAVRVESTDPAVPFVAQVWDGRGFADPPDPVDVTAGDVTGLDFAVVERQVISGQVFLDFDDDQVQDAGEPPFSNATIRVHDFFTGTHLAHGSIGADGVYAVSVEAGVYRVDASPHQGNLLYEYFDDVYFQEDAAPVDVTSADASGIDFGLVDGTTYGTLRGRLVATGTGAPVPDVHVQINRYDTGEHGWDGTTGADGSFVVVNLPPGSYSLYFETQGTNDTHDTDYVASWWSSTGLSNDPDPTHHRIDYPEIPGDGTDLGDVELEVGGSISGTVTRAADGTPVEGFSIACDLRSDPLGRGFGLGAQTDASGQYRVRGLLPGDYEVRTTGGVSGLVNTTYPDLVGMAAGGAVTGIDFALAAGTSISGTVSLSPDPGDGGATLQQMWVDAVDPETHQHLTSGSVASDGTYVIDNLAPGSYLVKTEQSNTPYISELWTAQAAVPGAPPVLDYGEATPIAVDAGSPATGIDFLLDEGRSITGHVFLDSLFENGVQDAGEPDVANANVQADLIDGGYGWGANTDGSGDFHLQGLLPGSYSVRVESSDPALPFVAEVWNGHGYAGPPDPVDVTSADATGIDFGVVQRRLISGQLFLDLNGDQIRQAGEPPFGNATIRVYDFATGTHLGHGQIGADGGYAIGVEAGVYRVEASPHQGSLLTEYWNDAYFWEDADPVDVTSADASGIDFGMVDAAVYGTLRGQVTGSGGIPGVDVQVWRFDDDNHLASTTTDANGDFVVLDLAPGSYKVFFETSQTNIDHGTNYVASFWSATGDPGVIDPGLLRVDFPTLPDPLTGPGTELDPFALLTGGSISGQVFPPEGESLPAGLTVSAQSFESGGQHVPGATVDGAGLYQIRGLPAPATYRVQADTRGTDFVAAYYLTASESTFDHGTAAAVDIQPATETGGVDLFLELGGEISGTVTGGGAPLENVGISVELVDDPLGRGYWSGAQTDASGHYTVSGLPAGDYRVRVDQRDSDWANAIYPGLVTVDPAVPVTGIDFDLEAAGWIHGRVTWSGGSPVVNIRVEANLYDAGWFSSDGYTDANGDFRVGALPQGVDYRLRVATRDGNDPQFFNFIEEYWDGHYVHDEADRVPMLGDGTEVVQISPFDFVLELGGAISGVVTDGVEGIQNVNVCAGDVAGLGFGNCDETDHNGFYIIRGLQPASYLVDANPWPQAFVYEIYDDTTDWNQATPVSVPAASGSTIPIVEHIDFVLAHAFRVSGRVTDGTTGIADLYVGIWNDTYYTDAYTQTDGTYELLGLPAGSYTVAVETSGTGWIRHEQPLEVVDADLVDVDFALLLGAVLSGRVFEDDGDGVYQLGEERSGVRIVAVEWASGHWIDEGESDSSGVYEIRGLEAGSYRVELQTGSHNFVQMYWDDVLFHHEATPVEIVEVGGELQDEGDIDFRVARGHEIRGTVFYDIDGNGQQDPGEPGVEGLGVEAWNDEGFYANSWGGTDSDGTYVIHSVYPALYRLGTRAQGTPYASELFKLESGWPVGTYVWSDADLVDVNDDLTGIDFSLDLGGGITGTVRDASTLLPLANVEIQAGPFHDSGIWFWTDTDFQGNFEIRGLPPVDHEVYARDHQGVYVSEYHDEALFGEDATPVQVAARSAVDDPVATTVNFYLDEGGALEGRVYDQATGSGIPNLRIYVEEHGQPNRYFGEASTEADGTYRVGALPPGHDFRLYTWDDSGDYFQVFYDGGDDLGSTDEADAVALQVSAGGNLLGVDFALEQAGALVGVVYFDGNGNGAPDEGEGVGNIWVDVEEFAEPHNYFGGTNTAADGTFRVGGLVPGLVRAYVSTYPTDYLQVIWDGGDDYGSPDWNDAAPLTVTAGGDTAANFALELGGSIAGTILGGDGEPVTDHWVNANDYDGGPFGNGGEILGNGTYTINGLKAGDYRVQSCGPERCEFYDHQTDWNLADRVTVTAGVTSSNIDFIFPKVPSISGGPTPAAGERGSTVSGVSLVVDNLAGGLCAEPAAPPCFEIALGGSGLAVQAPSYDAPSGTITFDLQIATDASLGRVSLSIVNHQLLEDSVATVTGAFEVQPAAGGEPAPSAERLYVADGASGTVRVYGVADNSLQGTIETIAHAEAVAASADGSHLYVSGSSRKLAVIDTRLGDVGEEVARIQLFGSFGGPRPLALASDYLYSVDRELENRVQVVDRATWQVRDDLEITLDSALWGLYLDPTGRHLWVILRNADSIAVIDLQPASGSHLILDPVPLPPGTQANDLAFTPDGARAYLAAQGEILAIDTALALTDPASAPTLVWPSGSGNIDVTFHAASGKTLAFIDAGEGVGALDVSTGQPQLLATFPAGESPYFGSFSSTPEKLYVYNADLYQLYVADVDSLVAGPAPSVVRFDARADGRGLLAPWGMTVAPTPASVPATAPVVTIAAGSPAVNGAPFQINLSGDLFAAEATVALQGTQIQGAVTLNSATSLTVDFPATTPTGDYHLAVTNPLPGGNESGLSATPLAVRPPPAFAQSQTLYVTHYGKASLGVLKPDGSVDTLMTSQAYPANVALTPDGRRGFVGHLDVSEWLTKPENLYDTTIVDLEPGSPTYLDTVGTAPWVGAPFSPMAVTPNLDNPNGVFAYAANRYLSDSVSVIDPVSGSEVDLDGDPATESIPWQHPWWWWMTWDTLPNYVAGINRIELDADVLDRNLQPNDVGLTPDGTLLYVVNRAGSVSIVDVAETHSVVGTLTHDGNFGLISYLEVAPAAVGGKVYVYVLGNDAAGNRSLFVFEAGQLDDASAFVHQIVLPVQDEFPREMSISGDGKTVYLTIRYQGMLLAMDVVPNQRGHYDSVCVTDTGSVVSTDSLCSAVSTPIVGLHHPVHAAADGLLYVNNGFGEQIFVLDAGDYQLITTLGDPDPNYLAVEPAAAVIKPVVTAVTPPSGSPDGGDPVVVTGANFQAGALVYFGTELATGVAVDSTYTLRAVTPASTPPGTTGAVAVKVENPDGRTGLLQAGFTYQLDITPPVFTTPPFIATQTLVGTPGSETVTAEVRWRTDEASTSFVDYHETGAPDFLQVGDGALVTDHLVILTGLAPGTGHELRATSADVHGNAASSPEAPATEPFTTPTAPDVTAPVITSGPAVTPGIDSALVQWETHEPASSEVHYDAQIDGIPTVQVAVAGGLQQHSVTLTGLAANTEYEYKVLSVDASGNGPTASAVATFTTDALPDATPPVITAGPEPSYLAQDLVILVWETDEPSTSFVNYGVSSVLEQGVIDVDMVTTHVVFLTNLLPGTVYGYQAGSTDAAGNTVLTADPFAAASSLVIGTRRLTTDLAVGRATLAAGTLLATKAAAVAFTTPEAPDLDPPVVTVTAAALSHDRARVSAESDEPASLRLRYGTAGLTATAFDPAFRQAPSLILAGLAAGTAYQIEAKLTDPKGNATVVSLSVTTPAAPDTTPPVLTGLATGPVGETTARISWQTDELADATVRFGPQGGALSRQASRLGLATSHGILLSGLAPGTAFAFAATSRDGSGNAATVPGSFTTATPPPRITSVTPARAAQGATVEVAVNGAHFGAAPQVEAGAGVTVSSLAVNALGSQVRAALAVDAAAAAGPRQITVSTAAGSASAPFTLVDQTVPIVTLDTPAAGAELQSLTVDVQGTLSELAAVTVNGIEATVSEDAGITYSATVTLPGAGPQGITATAVDPSGNRGSASVVVTVVNQPPVALCEDVVVALGPDCTALASIDAGSYDPDGEITLTQEPAGPFGPGEHAVTLTVEDGSGASASCTATVVAHFDFVGFLPPIGGADDTGGSYGLPVRTFNRNSTIPVKFALSCAGTPYLEGVHTLQTVQWSDDVVPGEPIAANPQDAATTGNVFRLEDGEWHFNLDVKGTGMGQGQWQLVATLSDSTRHFVWIQVK